MMTLLTIINTIILVILFGDKVVEIIKKRILDKTDLDEKLVEAIKDLINKNKKGN